MHGFPRTPISLALAAALSCAAAPSAGAGDFGELRLDGYATLAATRALTDGAADFRAAQFQSQGSGRSRDWDFANDSNLALQLSWDTPLPSWRAVAQVIVASDTYDDIKPRADWLYAGWAPRDDIALRLGRYPMPSGMQSETRWVGYSRLEVRAPLAVYFPMPLTSLDGADLSLTNRLGGLMVRSRIAYGNSEVDLQTRVGDSIVTVRDLVSLSFDVSQGAWRGYVGAFHADVRNVSPGTRQLYAALTQAAASYPPAAALAFNYNTGYNSTWQFDFGLEYQDAPWTLRTEAIYRKSPTKLVAQQFDWYAIAGYSIGRFTPFAAIAQIRFDDDYGPQPIPASPAAAVPALLAYNASLNTLDSTLLTAGIRWDLDRGFALKAQYDRHSLDAPNSRGVFANTAANFDGRSTPIHVFTLALDYQF
ncbi:hypothetical protein [Niveibacterium sp.]|uniref:hypothetical protein n=1 Tax=Niveibacterium sp. TaxID=2017444 RepID=UPI0035AEEC3D